MVTGVVIQTKEKKIEANTADVHLEEEHCCCCMNGPWSNIKKLETDD